ncbi:MAG: zinc-dependent metalloprotease [Candidatus Nanopelagicales bacterium]
MSNQPFGFGPNDSDDSDDDSSGPNFPGNFNISELGAALSQLGSMLQGASAGSSGSDPVNWPSALDTARKKVAADGDPVVGDAQARSVAESVRLADLWLDGVTDFPSTGADSRAWSRSQWLEATMPAWRGIINPVAEHITGSMTNLLPADGDISSVLPEQFRGMLPEGMPLDFGAMLGPLLNMAKQMGANVFAQQVGSALAELAAEVVGGGDVGLPLTGDGIATLIPANVAKFAEGLEIEGAEVELYLALREVAHQRLFTQVPWLAARVIGAVEGYARGIGLDDSRLGDMFAQIDIADPASLQEALSSGVLVPEDTPEQKAALERLETLLALIEGWVDHVVTAAVSGRLSDGARLAEAVRRRRGAGGPGEKTFATLVGLELRPRRLREAAALWSALEAERGLAGRDAVWQHPDLLPGAGDLADPDAFVAGSAITDDMMAELAGPIGGLPIQTAPTENASAADAPTPEDPAAPEAGKPEAPFEPEN